MLQNYQIVNKLVFVLQYNKIDFTPAAPFSTT